MDAPSSSERYGRVASAASAKAAIDGNRRSGLSARVTRLRCGAEAILAVPPVDPHGRQTNGPGRLVVVVQRLGDVQQLVPFDAEAGDCSQQRVEVGRCRLVRTDVLGGDDGVELHAQTLVARGERLAIDVRQDDQREALVQPGQRVGGVGERRPPRHGIAERLTVLGRGAHAVAIGDAVEDEAEHVGVAASRGARSRRRSRWQRGGRAAPRRWRRCRCGRPTVPARRGCPSPSR